MASLPALETRRARTAEQTRNKKTTYYCETVLSSHATIGAVQLKRAHSFILLFICEMPQLRDYL